MVMNRAEKRRLEKQKIKIEKPAVYNLTRDQYFGVMRSGRDEIKKEVTRETVEAVLPLMLGIPVLMFKDHFGDLIRKEVDGKNRYERFADYCLEYYRQFEAGLYTIDDIKMVLKTELGIEFELD